MILARRWVWCPRKSYNSMSERASTDPVFHAKTIRQHDISRRGWVHACYCGHGLTESHLPITFYGAPKGTRSIRAVTLSSHICLRPPPSTPTVRPFMPGASAKNVQLVGSVFERTPGPTSSPLRSPAPKTGFPPVQHRSKSAFARSRDLPKQSTGNVERPSQPPAVTSEHPRVSQPSSDEPEWRGQVGRENEKIVANMSPEERKIERQAILEQFGPEVGAILRKAKLNREKTRDGEERPGFGRKIEQVPGSPGKGLLDTQTPGSS